MAIDTLSKRLFVGGDKLALVDYTTGKVVTSVAICEGTDATWYVMYQFDSKLSAIATTPIATPPSNASKCKRPAGCGKNLIPQR